MGSSQWGKTSIALALVAFHIAHDPCPILVVQPTVKPMAEDFARNRLGTLIASTPVLRDAMSKRRQKDATNTILAKSFKGGEISIGGANSAASLASRSIRLLELDEIDRYPLELPGEGATIEIAIKRTTAYRGRRRVFLVSSPTLAGAPIDVWHSRGDQRVYSVPCPGCGFEHPYEWKNVKWKDGDPATARLVCPECRYEIDEAERIALLSKGRWVATNQDRLDKSIVSFHVWEAYSPFSSLSEIVKNFIAARKAQKEGDPAPMHTWENTSKGEPIQPAAGDGAEPHLLVARRESYGEGIDVPTGACLLTMGVDVQDDRLEALVMAWGPGEESWIVNRVLLDGDTSEPGVWQNLDELYEQSYRHEGGQLLKAYAMCVDSGGHRTTTVYEFAWKNAARRVFAIIGRAGVRPIVSQPSLKQWDDTKRKVRLYTIGVDAAKALLVSRFKNEVRGRGYFHIPLADWADEELAEQLTSERLVTRYSKGFPIREWQKIRARNEAFDCAVYALGALRLLHPNLDTLHLQISGEEPPPAPTSPPKAPRDSWLGERRGGWLKGRGRR